MHGHKSRQTTDPDTYADIQQQPAMCSDSCCADDRCQVPVAWFMLANLLPSQHVSAQIREVTGGHVSLYLACIWRTTGMLGVADVWVCLGACVCLCRFVWHIVWVSRERCNWLWVCVCVCLTIFSINIKGKMLPGWVCVYVWLKGRRNISLCVCTCYVTLPGCVSVCMHVHPIRGHMQERIQTVRVWVCLNDAEGQFPICLCAHVQMCAVSFARSWSLD